MRSVCCHAVPLLAAAALSALPLHACMRTSLARLQQVMAAADRQADSDSTATATALAFLGLSTPAARQYVSLQAATVSRGHVLVLLVPRACPWV